MRIRRSFPIVLAVVLVAGAIAIVVALRKHAPPEAARLLPGADGFLYINLQAIRKANLSSELPPVSHDPEYEHFIEATGFQFERDLDEAAFAIHNLVPPEGSKSSSPRFSEVMVGKIQGERLRGYLEKLARSSEEYNAITIYSIPLEGRVLRVAIVGVDTVAASNHQDPGVIKGMIDRSRKLASPFGGPALLRKYYKYIPLTNRYVPYAGLAWTVFKVQPKSEAHEGALATVFSKPAVMVASVRAFKGVHVAAEAFTADEEDARQAAAKTRTFLDVFHAAQSSSIEHGSDPDVKQFFESLKVEQHDSRVLLTAMAPMAFVHKALAAPPDEAPPAAIPAPEEKSKPSPK